MTEWPTRDLHNPTPHLCSENVCHVLSRASAAKQVGESGYKAGDPHPATGNPGPIGPINLKPCTLVVVHNPDPIPARNPKPNAPASYHHNVGTTPDKQPLSRNKDYSKPHKVGNRIKAKQC